MTQRGELRLYVTGSTLLSARAMENVEWMIREELGSAYHCEVVDVLERPELAEEDRVFATPALVRRSPAPVRKLIGDLSDRDSCWRACVSDVRLRRSTGSSRSGERTGRPTRTGAPGGWNYGVRCRRRGWTARVPKHPHRRDGRQW